MLKPCRRRKRSNDLHTALFLQLEYCVELFRLDMMVLADHSGNVVVSTQPSDVSTILAAWAPLLARNHFRDNKAEIMAAMQRHIGAQAGLVEVRRFQLAGDDYYVCTLGGLGARNDLALHRAVNGIRRIVGLLP